MNLTFPRVCGGDPAIALVRAFFHRLFPACAGVILPQESYHHQISTFPRVCGGDPEVGITTVNIIRFSPRVRG